MKDLFGIIKRETKPINGELFDTSDEENLKQYFKTIIKLAKGGEAFPVNLDDVWPLAYSRKDPAVRELKQTFMQDIDYKVFHKNVENLSGGRPTEEYFITTSCFEYLIARKVRTVFNVYREFFHKTVSMIENGTMTAAPQYDMPKTYSEALRQLADSEEQKERMAIAMKEQDNVIAEQGERIALQEETIKQSAPKVKTYDEYISSEGTFTTTQIAKEYGWGGKTLNKKLRDMGIQYYQNGQWLLYARYDGNGYTKSIPRNYIKENGEVGTQMQTVWTSKGREFIHEKLAN